MYFLNLLMWPIFIELILSLKWLLSVSLQCSHWSLYLAFRNEKITLVGVYSKPWIHLTPNVWKTQKHGNTEKQTHTHAHSYFTYESLAESRKQVTIKFTVLWNGCYKYMLELADNTYLWCDNTCLWADKSCLWCDNTCLWADNTCLLGDNTCLWCDNTCLWCDNTCLWADNACLWLAPISSRKCPWLGR